MQTMFFDVVRLYGARSLKRLGRGLHGISERLEAMNLLTKEERAILSRNGVFKNKHKGKRAFVIVNGPSLKGQDIGCLKNEITFAVAGFWKHPAVALWQPTYYSICDPAFFTDGPGIREFFQELNTKVPNSTFFLPLFRGLEANRKYGLLNPDRTHYVAAYGDPTPTVELTSLVQGFQSVSTFSLAQAIYMGCNPIYLLGFDHDFLAHRGIDHHFYAGCAIKGHRNESVPLSDRAPYDRDMEDMLKLWGNYRSLKSVAEAAGIRILNATDGGYLDVFERQNYAELVFTQ